MAESGEATSYFSRNVNDLFKGGDDVCTVLQRTLELYNIETQMCKTYLDKTEQNNSEKYVT